MKPKRYPNAIWTPTQDRWVGKADSYRCVVNHVMQGYTKYLVTLASTSPNTEDKLRVSAHFTIDRAGTVRQYVELGDFAWHAGRVRNPSTPFYDGTNPNRYTVGIEWEGFSEPTTYGYDYAYGTGRDRNGRERKRWPEPAIRAGIKLHLWLFQTGWVNGEPSNDSITGHFAFNSVTRPNDPGHEWVQNVQPRLVSGATKSEPQSAHATAENLPNLDWSILDRLTALENHTHDLSPPS